jgi:hypothetical protein
LKYEKLELGKPTRYSATCLAAGDHVSIAKVDLTKVSERHTTPLSQLDAGLYRVITALWAKMVM